LNSSNEIPAFNASFLTGGEIKNDVLDCMAYFLHLAETRDEFQGQKPISLINILHLHATWDATDERDKIWALLGCVSSTTDLPAVLLPNYSASKTEELYTDIARYALPSRCNKILPFHGIGYFPRCMIGAARAQRLVRWKVKVLNTALLDRPHLRQPQALTLEK
jgi:hypothetical protein